MPRNHLLALKQSIELTLKTLDHRELNLVQYNLGCQKSLVCHGLLLQNAHPDCWEVEGCRSLDHRNLMGAAALTYQSEAHYDLVHQAPHTDPDRDLPQGE